MAFSYVQGADTYSTSDISLNGVVAGNLLVAFATCAGANAPASAVSGGGTWQALTTNFSSSNESDVRLFYCLSATGGNSTFSATVTAAQDFGWGVMEFSYNSTVSFDTEVLFDVPSGTTWDAGDVTVANPSSLIVATISDELTYNEAISYDSPWVKIAALEDQAHLHSVAYRLVTSAGTYALSGTRPTASSAMVAATAVFYDAGDTGQPTLKRFGGVRFASQDAQSLYRW